ncbi:hypothetical protein M3E18_05695 [Kocuria sp. p3-SID1433]|uniref:hypothetical protein n=1 Tax=unclassified Kocuria TaxID=2649579 RepID=UPI0021A54B8A|nr:MULTISPECIES: hypothetical protein [unclassified Kocuria]MCT1601368.1 hypothetical protein [Kocuria sp. p3-SID1428]MCT2180036.1 hypothetical protein [Kocuria sp. p3-SID1433]
MADYPLNDRGSLQVVTENFYDAEIIRVFGDLPLGTPRSYDGPAVLVPEPDHPVDPTTITVRIAGQRVGHLAPQDAERYWPAITRVVASGYDAVAVAHLKAALVAADEATEVDADLRLDLSAPDLLFPLNSAPQRAAVLPQGSSIKVLEESQHADYLHSVLPRTGEGRVMLTLEVNQIRTPAGEHVDIVEVLHQRQVVGRLSTQMSEVFIPVIRHAFDHDLLTAAWGTIRGTSYEVSLTVQAARPDMIPDEWFERLPREFLPLEPEADSYRVPDAYVPSELEASRPTRWRRRTGSAGTAETARTAFPGLAGRGEPDEPQSPQRGSRIAGWRLARAGRADARSARAAGSGREDHNRSARPDGTFLGLLAITAALVVLGLIFVGREPLVTGLCLIAALAAGLMAFYLRSVMPGAPRPEQQDSGAERTSTAADTRDDIPAAAPESARRDTAPHES